MTKFKILALDLDGTLTKNDKTISQHTKEVLLRAQIAGTRIVLASGRPVQGMSNIAKKLQLQKFGGYILAYNGGKIVECSTKKELLSVNIPDEIKPYIYNMTKASGMEILTYYNGCVISEDPSNKYVQHASSNNAMPILKVDNFFTHTKELNLNKCLIVGEPQPLHELELTISHNTEGRLNVFRSEPFFLELVPPSIDKAQSLAFLLEKINMKREDLMACGDGFNDQSMIKYAGMGVAMENAQETVKNVADFVTSSNEQDGVAKAVEKFILENN
ncbi:MAG: Cof-type HAD-IIB family hydrolase [Bacteroidaceae bacterium]|nr:Cof-type HAD-IIB family hydrolase [Bacteroidaceae bacterium]